MLCPLIILLIAPRGAAIHRPHSSGLNGMTSVRSSEYSFRPVIESRCGQSRGPVISESSDKVGGIQNHICPHHAVRCHHPSTKSRI
jgi:hypothetical protein